MTEEKWNVITESYAVLRMLVVFSENQEVSFGSSLLKVSRKLYIFGIEKNSDNWRELSVVKEDL